MREPVERREQGLARACPAGHGDSPLPREEAQHTELVVRAAQKLAFIVGEGRATRRSPAS
jgi:hypothetical protein